VDQEAALLRTLRDIADGHLFLWLKVAYFDDTDGHRLDQPQVRQVTPDREPYRGVPDRTGAWWTHLLDRGWLELPAPGSAPMRYLVSPAGQTALESSSPR
jgi:hypothetical protein